MMKRKATLPLQYISAGLLVLYVIYIALGRFEGAFPEITPHGIICYSLFLLALFAVATSWINRLVSGLLHFLWITGVFINELLILQTHPGLRIVPCIMALVVGATYILRGIEDRQERKLSINEKIKIILQSLSIVYLTLFLLIVAFRISPEMESQWFSLNWVLIILNIALFAAAFIWSWKKEFFSGLAMVGWYITLFLLSETYGLIDINIYHALLFLLHGIFYIVYSYSFKEKKYGVAKYRINLYNLF